MATHLTTPGKHPAPPRSPIGIAYQHPERPATHGDLARMERWINERADAAVAESRMTFSWRRVFAFLFILLVAPPVETLFVLWLIGQLRTAW